MLSTIILLLSCEKNVEDNLQGHTWNYEATYTIQSTPAEVIKKTGQFTFNKDKTGKQVESEIYEWTFRWGSSSDYVAIEYDSGGYLEFNIKVNEEKKQEWTSEAYYVYPDSSSFLASINMKLSR